MGGESVPQIDHQTQPKTVCPNYVLFVPLHLLYCTEAHTVQVLAHRYMHDLSDSEMLNPGGQV